MKRSANKSEFGNLGYYYFIYLCSINISDFMVLLRILIMARVISASCFYSEDYFKEV